MQVFRAVVACLSVVALSLSGMARAEPMPAMPDAGAQTTAPMPPLRGITGAGRGPGGVDANRIEKTIKGVSTAAPPLMRGQAEQTLFNAYARSVVLIVTKEELSSGSVIGVDGTILTTARAVAGSKSVGVIFKPPAAGATVRESDAVKAVVVRVDEIADLAVIKVALVPRDVRPLRLGDLARVQVGAGVHAIGHPFGEAWSYTKGIVRQVQLNYVWKADNGIAHRADVVQTQTPVNPGTSGGALLNDGGEIVGVNAFGRVQGSELNFAIAPTEARRVLQSTSDRLAPKAQTAASTRPCAEPVRLGTRRARNENATIFSLDANCNGSGDSWLVVPDVKTSPIMLFVDANENGKSETTYVDNDHDLRFDKGLYDTNEDGKTDLIGYDLNDELEPGRIVLAKS